MQQNSHAGTLRYVAVAIDPIHHGAGTEGNTQLLRTQDIMLPDGTPARVPFISGNSFKHLIREGGARFCLDAMAIRAGTLTKEAVDLLFSGGALTKSGSNVNIERARQIADLFPLLSVCGYASGNFMQQSKLLVSHMHLVCIENAWRLPGELTELPQASKRAASFRGEEFGTRHDTSRNPKTANLLRETDQDPGGKKNTRRGKVKDATQQMIYDFEVVRPGSIWFGDLIFEELTAMELAALRAAIETACAGYQKDAMVFHVGAKAGVGMGRIALTFNGDLRTSLSPPSFSPAEGIMPMPSNVDVDTMAVYVDHLRKHADEIMTLLNGVA